MKALTAIFALLSSIWIPALIEYFYPINSWLAMPVYLSFISMYLLAFFALTVHLKSLGKDQ
jgi:hypothetical protein